MQTEVIFLGQLRHPHLVKLIGYCYEDEHRLLVYEFMTRGSLEKHLFKSKHTLQIKLQVLTFQTFSLLTCQFPTATLQSIRHVIFLYMPAARVKLNTRTHTASRA